MWPLSVGPIDLYETILYIVKLELFICEVVLVFWFKMEVFKIGFSHNFYY